MIKIRPFETVTVSYSARSEAHLTEQMTVDIVGRLKGFRPFMVTKCGDGVWRVVYGTDA